MSRDRPGRGGPLSGEGIFAHAQSCHQVACLCSSRAAPMLTTLDTRSSCSCSGALRKMPQMLKTALSRRTRLAARTTGRQSRSPSEPVIVQSARCVATGLPACEGDNVRFGRLSGADARAALCKVANVYASPTVRCVHAMGRRVWRRFGSSGLCQPSINEHQGNRWPWVCWVMTRSSSRSRQLRHPSTMAVA